VSPAFPASSTIAARCSAIAVVRRRRVGHAGSVGANLSPTIAALAERSAGA
jgi:hypothetical protein